MINKRSLQNKSFKQVVVPSKPISIDEHIVNEPEILIAWSSSRRRLEMQKVFTSGSVKLRKANPGDLSKFWAFSERSP